MGCSLNGAMQGRGMVHHPHGRMCAVEGLHYGTAWRHGTAQRLPEFTSRAARARHEVAIESLTYKFINPPFWFFYSYSILYKGIRVRSFRDK